MHKNTNRLLLIFGHKPLKQRIFGIVSVLWCLLLLFMFITVLNGGSISGKDRRSCVGQDSLQTQTEVQDKLKKAAAGNPANKGEQTKKFDILINSYMRSGSSFTGQLLAFRPDTFYWYEPLLSYHGLYYFMGRYACIGNNVCGDFGNERVKQVNKLLRNIYTCNFTTMAEVIADNITAEYSGEKWKSFEECQAQNNSIASCLVSMEDTCKHSNHRATKIVRLSVDNLEYVLENNVNLKAIHLFRDPRAIINSELTTKWYNLKSSDGRDFSQIKSNAYELCSRMKYDLFQGEKMKKKFPHRFTFVMFEDLQSDLKFKTEVLYSYFGIDKSNLQSKLNSLSGILQEDHEVNRTRGDYKDWWRFHMNFKAVEIIDNICADVLTFLGYRRFSDESEFMNVLNKGFDFRKEFLISNLNKSTVYNFEALHNSKHPYFRSIDIIPEDSEMITRQRTLVI